MVKIRPTPYEQVDQFAQETRLAARIFEELARGDDPDRKPKGPTVPEPRCPATSTALET